MSPRRKTAIYHGNDGDVKVEVLAERDGYLYLRDPSAPDEVIPYVSEGEGIGQWSPNR